MVLKHIRHVVTVYGDKRPYLGNEGYYDAMLHIAHLLMEEMEQPVSFKSRLHNDQTAVIAEIASQSREYAEKLAKDLEKLNLYPKIEVDTQEIDIEKMAKDRGVNPNDLESLLKL